MDINDCNKRTYLAERLGFVPANPAHINNLGPFSSAETARNTQNLSIRYKTGTANLAVRLPWFRAKTGHQPERTPLHRSTMANCFRMRRADKSHRHSSRSWLSPNLGSNFHAGRNICGSQHPRPKRVSGDSATTGRGASSPRRTLSS